MLTRLHARYGKDGISEDLIFKEAKGIAGGREWRQGGQLEQQSKPSPRNMFQARYAIRHAWKGKIECESPIRGRWGGPPRGSDQSAKPKAAKDLAFVKRGAELARLVAQDVPEIAVTANAAGGPSPKDPGTAEPSEKPSTPPNTGDDAKKKESKGCAASGTHSGGLLALLGLVALIGWRRRRSEV